MPDTSTIYLPVSTAIHVRAFTNAGFTQKVTITQENGTVTTLEGSGERDHPMPNGDFWFNTPASTNSPLGYKVTIEVQSYYNNAWQPSQVSSASCGVMYYSLAMVVSEDYVDNDWNDGVVQFTWWTPPTSRNPEDHYLRAGKAIPK